MTSAPDLAWIRHSFLRSRILLNLGAPAAFFRLESNEDDRDRALLRELSVSVTDPDRRSGVVSAAEAWQSGWAPGAQCGAGLWSLIHPYRSRPGWAARSMFPDEARFRSWVADVTTALNATPLAERSDSVVWPPAVRALREIFDLCGLSHGSADPHWHRYLEWKSGVVRK
jgi:hypothetical protein